MRKREWWRSRLHNQVSLFDFAESSRDAIVKTVPLDIIKVLWRCYSWLFISEDVKSVPNWRQNALSHYRNTRRKCWMSLNPKLYYLFTSANYRTLLWQYFARRRTPSKAINIHRISIARRDLLKHDLSRRFAIITPRLDTKSKQNENKQLKSDLNGMSDNKRIITCRASTALTTRR